MSIHLILQVLIVGAGFAMYPMFLGRSGLSGSITSVVFGAGVFLVSMPFAFGTYGQMGQVKWSMLIPAILIVGFSVLLYVSAIMKTPVPKISTLVSFMTVGQIVTAAVMDAVLHGNFSVKRATGFLLVALAAPLLIKG